MSTERSGLRECLERIYSRYNRREYVHPDPLEFLYDYIELRDREIVGLVASGLAYGRVAQILRSTSRVLSVLGEHPAVTLESMSRTDLEDELRDFKHRFTTSLEMAALLRSASALQREWGSLDAFFSSLLSGNSYAQALDGFVSAILKGCGMGRNSLLPRPSLGSACKRLHLYMRWMVRKDDVDPGGWTGARPSDLIVPLDVHMFRAARALGFTRKKNSSCRAAVEITSGFREIDPGDPVRYDFALTRMGIGGREDEELYRELYGIHGCFVDTET